MVDITIVNGDYNGLTMIGMTGDKNKKGDFM